MNMLKKVIFILCLGLGANVLCAQQPVYTCDFEDPTENSKWILNPVNIIPNVTMPPLGNKWWIGEPGDFSPTGSKGLYISSDANGAEAVYSGDATMFATAAREMPNLPQGDYRLYFDWQCGGKKTGEGFFVCWVPIDTKTNSAPSTGDKPKWVTDYQCDSVFALKNLWTVGAVDIKHDGTPHKLVFVWYSTQGKAVPPAACIDNLELRPISENEQCAVPTKVSHTIAGDTVILSWKGNADYYDVRCYDYVNDKWFAYNKVQGNSCIFPNVAEGVQTFIIRAYCAPDKASEYVQYTQFIFHKGVRCIDYMDLKGKCYTGSYATRVKNQRPFSFPQQVDYGYKDPRSKHTLHYEPNEYDELTNYQLRTCPEGYITSVRLGNADTGDGTGESIEYKYKVADGASAILKIKYALVLSNPHPGSPQDNPQFWLDILSEGKVIKNECGFAMFTAGDSEDSKWLLGATANGTEWMYKEWTEHSINLQDYIGKTLTIRLVTTDCKPSAHTGYVYFVLDCEEGGMSGLNCGEDNPTTEFEAPSGFDYVWYRADMPLDTLATDQRFHIEPMDTNTYCVNVINKNNPNCWYTLSAIGKPRIPTPMATYRMVAERCQNVVTFENQSCVFLQNLVTDELERTSEPVTSLTWDFGDGVVETSSTLIGDKIQHVYPPEGGRYVVKLTAGISNDACLVTDSIILNLPDLSTPVTEVVENVCRAEYPFGFPYAGVWLYEDVDSTFTLISQLTGCDSLCHLVLKFHDVMQVDLYDTICENEFVTFFDKQLSAAGLYKDTIVGAFGCDSIVSLDLYVEPMLSIDLQDSLIVCVDNKYFELPYEIYQGNMDSLIITFDTMTTQVGFLPRYVFSPLEVPVINLPNSVIPGIYSFVVSYSNTYCQISSDTVALEIAYSASITTIKTNLLGIENDEYNGGYAFSCVQWYKDGQPIPGATDYNLAVSDEDLGHEFFVRLCRSGDNALISSCPVVYLPTGLDQLTISALNWPLQVYNILGLPIGKMGWDEFVTLPTGVYLISDEKNTIKVIL